MRGWMLRLVWSGLVVLAAGCGAVQAGTAIASAETAVSEAQEAGAAKYSRYRFEKARLLLEGAQREHGYARYATARAYAEEATRLAHEAREEAQQRRELELRRMHRKRVHRLRAPGKRGGPKPAPERRTILPPIVAPPGGGTGR